MEFVSTEGQVVHCEKEQMAQVEADAAGAAQPLYDGVVAMTPVIVGVDFALKVGVVTEVVDGEVVAAAAVDVFVASDFH